MSGLGMVSSDKTDIDTWKQRIIRAEAFQNKQKKMWNDAVDLYNCDFFDKHFGTDSERVDVHFASWYIDNLVPLVYFRDPFIFVKSRNEKYSGFAETLEDVINYYWKELYLKQEIKRVIKSSFMMPPGWIKIGYTAELGTDVAEIKKEKEKTAIQQIKDSILGVFKKDEKSPLTPEQQGELNLYIKEENIFATWIPSWNVLMPEGYHVIDKMPWIIEWEDLQMEDFLSNPLYKNKENLEADRRMNMDRDKGKAINKVTYDGVQNLNDDDIIRVYHIWDRRGQKRKTVSMRSEKEHFSGDWPYDLEGFPYLPLVFDESLPTDQKSNPYPSNCLKSIMPQIVEVSMLRTQMTKWRKRASAIILAQKGLLTEDDMQQFTETEALQVCLVSNIAAVQMTQTPSLPQEVFQVEGAINRDLQMGTNMGQMMFSPMPGQRTATQATIAQSGLQLKAQSRIDVVEDFTVKLARGMAQLAWQFLDKEKVEEIIGENVTDSMWPKLPEDKKERRRIIQAELSIKIDAGSTAAPKDETVDKKQFIDATSVMMAIAPDRIKKDEFLKIFAKKFKFTRDVDRIIITNDDAEREAAQQENQLLNSEVPQVVSPNENHKIHMEEHIKGGKPTKAMDIHLLEHGKYLGINPKTGEQESGGAQQGDVRPPAQSTNPDIMRKGNTSPADIQQSVNNQGPGTGSPSRAA